MISLKPEYFDIVIEAKDRMVRKGKWKLTYQPLNDGAIYRLFDIESDPGCTDNLIDRHPGVAADLRSLLDGWMTADSGSMRASRSHPRAQVADADEASRTSNETVISKTS